MNCYEVIFKSGVVKRLYSMTTLDMMDELHINREDVSAVINVGKQMHKEAQWLASHENKLIKSGAAHALRQHDIQEEAQKLLANRPESKLVTP